MNKSRKLSKSIIKLTYKFMEMSVERKENAIHKHIDKCEKLKREIEEMEEMLNDIHNTTK